MISPSHSRLLECSIDEIDNVSPVSLRSVYPCRRPNTPPGRGRGNTTVWRPWKLPTGLHEARSSPMCDSKHFSVGVFPDPCDLAEQADEKSAVRAHYHRGPSPLEPKEEAICKVRARHMISPRMLAGIVTSQGKEDSRPRTSGTDQGSLQDVALIASRGVL
ncbi:uncharacterized protein EI90DRAFT_2259046 [Cantharellus anzutake]|uniref:uncharacterized protein n=1 Tax=Cantharellus anzutake TaxID=1750568 RepID=UPI001907CB62|nr:uncharacterized protein EI90DRAFT_2259046 [Cantharellus anzutake]KAF8339615.1 hypothetical protein EI90DRAFT_2259046 [Cantharellus anzutake]